MIWIKDKEYEIYEYKNEEHNCLIIAIDMNLAQILHD